MKPRRDSRYLQWIRTLPCAVCRTTRNIEAAHTGGHGLGQKAPDSTAIPLCVTHHRTANDCYHKLGPRKFAEVHKLNITEIVAWLNAKPSIRVISGTFVGSFHHERYVLGSTERGLSHAVRKMIELWRTIQIEVSENQEEPEIL
jgi:hypothetical protein